MQGAFHMFSSNTTPFREGITNAIYRWGNWGSRRPNCFFKAKLNREKACLKSTLFLQIDAHNNKIIFLWVGEQESSLFLG